MGAGQRAAGRQALDSSTCREGESVTWLGSELCGGASRRWWKLLAGGGSTAHPDQHARGERAQV